MTTQRKKRSVKAWAVTDGKNILNIGTRTDTGVFRGLYVIGTEKEYMEGQWNPFEIIECTITFTVGKKK